MLEGQGSLGDVFRNKRAGICHFPPSLPTLDTQTPVGTSIASQPLAPCPCILLWSCLLLSRNFLRWLQLPTCNRPARTLCPAPTFSWGLLLTISTWAGVFPGSFRSPSTVDWLRPCRHHVSCLHVFLQTCSFQYTIGQSSS